MKERNYNYDILRIFACLLIVCMHSPMPSENANGMFLSVISYFTAPGLCLFFVLSGALLLPVKTDTFAFLKKRLSKVVAPTVLFSLFYMALNVMDGKEVDWITSICSMPFSPQGHGVLWFMYTLIGLYLLSPILSRWLESTSKREVKFYLGIWGITLCYPILGMFVGINNSDTGILYYFQGYVGYFLLGYYLMIYSISWKIVAPAAVVAIAAPVFCKLGHIEVDFYTLFWYLSIFVAILAVAMFKVFTIKKVILQKGGALERLITTISGLSFGIYLIHIAVMRFFLWKQDWIINISNYYVRYIAIVLLTFAVSFVITYIISLLPFSEYIIGFKSNINNGKDK